MVSVELAIRDLQTLITKSDHANAQQRVRGATASPVTRYGYSIVAEATLESDIDAVALNVHLAQLRVGLQVNFEIRQPRCCNTTDAVDGEPFAAHGLSTRPPPR